MLHDWIVGGVCRSHACHMTLDCERSVLVTCMPHDWIVRGVYKRGGGCTTYIIIILGSLKKKSALGVSVIVPVPKRKR